MKRSRTILLRTALDAMYATRAHRVMAPFTEGCGLIFTLHHVEPDNGADFAPNRILSVTPDFLEAVIRRVRELDLDIVSLDEACRRIASDDAPRRFVAFTFDDGYRDNLEFAWPIFRRHEVPLAIYVATCLPDGTARLWWRVLEEVVAAADRIEETVDGRTELLDCGDTAAKYEAYEAVYWHLRALPEAERRIAVEAMAARYGIDMDTMAAGRSMSWDEIAALSREPLVTIGAHSVGHPSLASISPHDLHRELAGSRNRIAEMTGVVPRHFAYPYGDAASAGEREFDMASRLGFASAVTTRPGILRGWHRTRMTALPRISLNGDYQSLRYVDLFLTGAPFALWNGLRRGSAA